MAFSVNPGFPGLSMVGSFHALNKLAAVVAGDLSALGIAKMRTGENVRNLALYASSCCSAELIFGTPDIFSRCPQCAGVCFWTVEEKLVSWQELEKISEREAA
jgi:hypothetical protein